MTDNDRCPENDGEYHHHRAELSEMHREKKQSRIEALENDNAELQKALTNVCASLVAAISLLEKGGKVAAPSNKMFDQMLMDYKASIDRARAVLKEKPEK